MATVLNLYTLFLNIPLDAPGPVTNLRAQDVTYDSVELTWQPPSDDGGGTPSFIVDKREHGSEVWSRAASTGQNKATLLMLTPGVEYSFRVKADNMYGTSEPVEVKHTIHMKGIHPLATALSFMLLDQYIPLH